MLSMDRRVPMEKIENELGLMRNFKSCQIPRCLNFFGLESSTEWSIFALGWILRSRSLLAEEKIGSWRGLESV